MQRTRPSPALSLSASPSEDEATPVPWLAPVGERPALGERLNVLRGATATPRDVEALLEALGQPPGGEETPRARADVLLEALEDSWLAEVRTADGRPLRAALLEALLALGYPYALEVPPAVLAEVRREGWGLTPGAKWGLVVALGALVAQGYWLGPPVLEALAEGRGDLLGLLALGAWVLPTGLAVLGGALPSRAVRWLGAGLMALGGLGWGAASALDVLAQARHEPDPYEYSYGDPSTYSWESALGGLSGVLLLVGAWLLRRPWRGEEED